MAHALALTLTHALANPSNPKPVPELEERAWQMQQKEKQTDRIPDPNPSPTWKEEQTRAGYAKQLGDLQAEIPTLTLSITLPNPGPNKAQQSSKTESLTAAQNEKTERNISH